MTTEYNIEQYSNMSGQIDLADLDPIAVLPLIKDALEKREYQPAVFMYVSKMKEYDEEDRIEALNLFAVKLETMLGSNMHTLSDLATVFSQEAGFKEEYQKVCEKIQDRLSLTQGC